MNFIEKILINISNEISKFFTYSSIQAKIIATILGIVLIVILRRTIINLFISRLEDAKIRYNWSRVTSYAAIIFGV